MSSSLKNQVTSFFAALNVDKLPEAFEQVAPQARWWVAGNLPFSGDKSKAEYMQIAAGIQKSFPAGLRFEIKDLIAEGASVAAEVESLGKHVNGKTYRNRYHFKFRFEGGKIVDVKEYMDTQHLKDLIS